MKNRVLILVAMFLGSMGGNCFASLTVKGLVRVDASGIFIPGPQTCKEMRLIPKNNEAAQQLNKLSSGDSLTASGLVDPTNCEARIESVEYVGLRKLLGYWAFPHGIVTVKDFETLSFYPMKPLGLPIGSEDRTGDPVSYRYSVTPSEGREWVLFLSNTEDTTFATLEMNRDSAILKVHDSDTGEVTQTLRLKKWGDLPR